MVSVSVATIEPISEPNVIVPWFSEVIDEIFKSPLLIIEISSFALALTLLTSMFIFVFWVASKLIVPFSAFNSNEFALIFTILSNPPSFSPDVARYALSFASILILLISEYG